MTIPAIRSNSGIVRITTSGTVTKPTGTLSGDSILMTMLNFRSSDTHDAVAQGWVQRASIDTNDGYSEFSIFTREAGGSEPADYSLTLSGAGLKLADVAIITFVGAVDFTSLLFGTVNSGGMAGVLINLPSITTTTADNLILAFYGQTDANVNAGPFTAPSGMAHLLTNASLAIDTLSKPTAGATGALTATATNAATTCGIVVALRPAPTPATGVTLSGPSTGTTGSPSTNFTVGVNPSGGTITGTVVVTPAATGCTFTPSTVSLSAGTPTATFTCTAASNGAKTISVTNDGSLTNPSSLTYTASSTAATAIVVSGPSSGATGAASTNFTASANGVITGTVVITPTATGCTFTPSTVSISSGTPTATFTCTPASAGAKTISFANNGGLTNQANLTYTASGGGSVTFTTPLPLGRANGGAPRAGMVARVSVMNLTAHGVLASPANVTFNSAGLPPPFSVTGPVAGTTYPVMFTNVDNPLDFALIPLTAV